MCIRDRLTTGTDVQGWALMDDPAISNDHWTDADWYEPNTSYGSTINSPIDLPVREHLRRLSVFGHAYQVHLAYINTIKTSAFGRAFTTDDDGRRSSNDHLLDSPYNLPPPVYSILTRAQLLDPLSKPRPIFAT